MDIPLFRPTIRRHILDSVLSCLVADTLGPGRTNRDLVAALADYLGLKGGIATSAYAASVGLALDLIGVVSGDGVIVSALSPSVYQSMIEARGARALFADVEAHTTVVKAGELERCLSEGGRAALIHHTLGAFTDVSPCLEADIPVAEDISQSLLPHAEDGLFGRGADVYLLSLDSENFITTGSGGAVLCARRSQVDRLRELADRALEIQLLPDMNAALGLSQMRDLDRDVSKRRELSSMFAKSVARSRHASVGGTGTTDSIPFSFPVRVMDSMPEVRRYARKRSLETRPAFERACVGTNAEVAATCPGAGKLAMSCLLFPLYPMMSRSQAETVSRVLSTLP